MLSIYPSLPLYSTGLATSSMAMMHRLQMNLDSTLPSMMQLLPMLRSMRQLGQMMTTIAHHLLLMMILRSMMQLLQMQRSMRQLGQMMLVRTTTIDHHLLLMMIHYLPVLPTTVLQCHH